MNFLSEPTSEKFVEPSVPSDSKFVEPSVPSDSKFVEPSVPSDSNLAPIENKSSEPTKSTDLPQSGSNSGSSGLNHYIAMAAGFAVAIGAVIYAWRQWKRPVEDTKYAMLPTGNTEWELDELNDDDRLEVLEVSG
jgi:hypothetical protein